MEYRPSRDLRFALKFLNLSGCRIPRLEIFVIYFASMRSLRGYDFKCVVRRLFLKILFYFGAILCPRLTWKSCKHSRPKIRPVYQFATLNADPTHENYNETNPCQEPPPPTNKGDISDRCLVFGDETSERHPVAWRYS